MSKEYQSKNSLEIAKESYKEYGLEISRGRAYSCLKDGLKSSYRRAIYGMYLNNKHKIVKVAELAAHALPYHPHPTSVSGVVVQLGEKGNKLRLMETQGNWGDSTKKILPAADRYIGGYLSPLAEKLLCDAVEYSHFVKGEIEKDEPEALPVLLPLCFINGQSGIPSGLPAMNIPTVDIDGMIDYYIDILKHKDLSYVPKKLPKPNYHCEIVSDDEAWAAIMKTGKGTIKLAPVMTIEGNVITVTEMPYSKDVESVRAIVEKEVLGDKIDIRDESDGNTRIVIEKVPYKQVDMEDIYCRLYNKLQTNEKCNMAFYDADNIYVPCGFDRVVKSNIQYLIDTHSNRIIKQLQDLRLKLRVLEIIEDLKAGNRIKKLVEMSTTEAVSYIAKAYKTTEDVASKVFQKPLSYLTKAHVQEIIDLQNEIKVLEDDQSDIFEFLIKKYKDIRKDIKKQLEKQKLDA